mgnify:FL=1
MAYISIEEAVKRIQVPSKEKLGDAKYKAIKVLQHNSRKGTLGKYRFQEFADEFAPGKFRAILMVEEIED